MRIPSKDEILLESGTNEIEIMEFTIAGEVFGINVAKVREIMMSSPVKLMPNAHPAVEGIFKPRDLLMTVIDLPKYLNLPESENQDKDIFIIADFNNMNIAFHVHTVVGIARISWGKISKPDTTIYGGEEGIATGIAEYENHLITILDFEKIVWDINPENGIQMSDLDFLGDRSRMEYPILIAEDSMLLSKMIVESLHKAGYTNVIKTNNGKEAWDFLNETKIHDEPLEKHVSCLITDIEMPQMDGHRLIKLIKDDAELKHIPIIIFSSLINQEMKIKGQQLGANEQISKPEIAQLVSIVDRLVIK